MKVANNSVGKIRKPKQDPSGNIYLNFSARIEVICSEIVPTLFAVLHVHESLRGTECMALIKLL